MKLRRNTCVILSAVLTIILTLSLAYFSVSAETLALSSNDLGTTSTYNIYVNLEYSDSENWGLSYHNQNSNQLAWEQKVESKDGYLRLNKCSNTDVYIDVNDLTMNSDFVVFEQDIYLEESHPNAVLFYLRDSVTTGSNVVSSLAEISENKLKISNQTVDITTSQWHRISAVVDFQNSKYDIYLNRKLVFSDIEINTSMKMPSLWRTYIGSNSPSGVLYTDNMRVYDGKKPRQIGGHKNIYTDLQFENSENWGLSYNKTNGNQLSWNENSVTGNGYLRLDKNNSNDAYLDINNLTFTSNFVVFEQDIYLGQSNPSGLLFYLRDSVTTGSNLNVGLIEVVAGGLKHNNNFIEVSTEQWHRVSAVLDFINCRYDIYLNGELIFENLGLNANLQAPSLWRIYMYGGEPYGTISYDNLHVYDGTEPMSIEGKEFDGISIFTDEAALALLNGRTALQPYGNAIFTNGRKEDVVGSIIIEDEEVLVPKNIFEKLFGEIVNVDGNSITIGNKATFTVGEKYIYIANTSLVIPVAPRIENGEVLLPICAFGENALAEGHFVDDGYGMYIVGGSVINTSDSRLKDANLYLFFERKSNAELKELLIQQNGSDLSATHPRVLADTDDFSRIRSEIESNQYKAAWFAQVKDRADSYLEQPMLEYKITNGRLLDVSNNALKRVSDLGMVWQITGQQKYGARLILELENISTFQDWHPDHTLDTGTMAMAAALAYDWGYNAMTQSQRENIAQRLFNLGLKTAHDAYYGKASYATWWTNTETNWGVVVNSGFLNLALSIAEVDIDYAMDVVKNAKRSMENTVYRIAPDGAWYEGPGYWSYLFQFLSYTMAGYESSFGVVDELLDFKGIEGYAGYQMYFSDPNGDVNNFHDSDEGAIGSYGTFYLAEKLSMPFLMNYRTDFMEQKEEVATAFDLLWYNVSVGESNASENFALDAYYRQTEFVSMRQKWNDDNALWVSTHGGSLNAAHDHIDVGTFVLNLGGVRWAVDLPKEMLSYVSDADNPSIQAGYNSYYFYRRKGEGHNIVVINPDNQLEMDQSKRAKVIKHNSGIGRSYSVIDLSAAYNQDVNSYLRGYLLSNGRRAFTVRDEIDLKTANSELFWFMHTEGEITIVDNNTAVIIQDGKQLKVQFLTNAQEHTLSIMPAAKLPSSSQFTESANPDVTKLALRIVGSGEINITVKMSLVGEDASQSAPENIPISQWSVADDNVISDEGAGCAKRLSSITINGLALIDFEPETFSYVYGLDEDETTVTVAAEGNGQVEIVSYPRDNGYVMKEIRVYDGNGKYTSYIVMIEPYSPQSLTRFVRHVVISADASAEQQDEPNYCENSFDGDMETRWSAEGIGQWCVHDLGEVKRIDAFGVALWKGDQRQFYFDIEISEDGVTFTPIVEDYVSSGTKEDIEVILLSENVSARYVRYVGYGSSVNQWNNVIEFATYIDKRALNSEN